MLLFGLCAAGFANLLRVILRRMNLIAACVPIILCACLFLTPVFIDLVILEPVQMLLPTYLYLKSIHSVQPLWMMAAYAAAAAVLGLIFGREQSF